MVHVLETANRTETKTVPKQLAEFIAHSVDSAASDEHPFLHLVLRDVFPDDVYAAMVEAMPVYDDYRPMHGRSKTSNTQGNSTRVKIDLFPEYIRHLPTGKREVWEVVGRALTSKTVQAAFVRRLAPELEKRFGSGYEGTGFFPIPILTRDIPGYKIKPHTDTHWKGITVQLYLPQDASTSHIGTIFHDRLPDGTMPKSTQMQFIPNSGYAFSVSDTSWHSADPVGPEVATRDSILLTYFVDQGPLRFVRNRAKRLGNFISNEFRNR
jgi:hypothetical protein